MTQADIQSVCGGVGINTGRVATTDFNLILHIGSDGINVGTLAKRVVVANANDVTLEVKSFAAMEIFETISLFSIKVTDTKHCFATSQRSVASQADRIALNLVVSSNRVIAIGHFDVIDNTTKLRCLDFVKVLGAEVDLDNFEIIATTQRNGQAVVNAIGVSNFGTKGCIVDRVNS